MIGDEVKFDVSREVDRCAYDWWSRGFNVVPFLIKGSDDKQPLVKWKQWENKYQTAEEFMSLLWDQANGFAVLCGQPNQEGLSLCVVDFDVKKTSREAQELGRKVIRGLRVTARERTISGGEHLIYLSRKPVKTISAFHNSVALELLGERKLCIMYPSEGYKKINDNLPSEIANLESEFYSALRKVGVEVSHQKLREKRKTVLMKKPVRPCFERLMQKEKMSHDERVALVIELEHAGYLEEEIKKIFHEHRSWEMEYDEEKTDKQIESILGRYGQNKRETLERLELCFDDCPLRNFDDCRKVLFESAQDVRLVFKIISKKEVKVKVMKGNEALTAWVTLDKPEKLRTSRNTKIIRDILKKEHSTDWKNLLEKTIEQMQAAVANIASKKQKKDDLPQDQAEAIEEILTIVKEIQIIKQLDEETSYPVILKVEWNGEKKNLIFTDKSIFSLTATKSQFLRAYRKIPPSLFEISAKNWGKHVINNLGFEEKIKIVEQEESTENYICQLITMNICRSRSVEDPKEALIPGNYLWMDNKIWVPNTHIREILRTENINTNLRKVREWVKKGGISAGDTKLIRLGSERVRFWPFLPQKIGADLQPEEIPETSVQEGKSEAQLEANITVENIKNTVWDDSFWGKHECCICGYEKWTSWKALLKDGREAWICEDCKRLQRRS